MGAFVVVDVQWVWFLSVGSKLERGRYISMVLEPLVSKLNSPAGTKSNKPHVCWKYEQ